MTLIATAPSPSSDAGRAIAPAWRRPDAEASRTYLIYGGITALLFILGYGGANWLAAQRETHFRLYWDGELAVPLVPQAIWIYLSINLLFLLPLFRLDRAGMAWLGRRMIAATLIASAFFLVLPTTVGFARLEDGLNPAFNLLYALDYPFNCAPSLHVAYSALIIAAVWRGAGRHLRAALATWLVMIIASTIFTHQHHLFDAASALLLVGLLCRIGRDRIAAEVKP
jgi:hypothetical protein